MNSHAYEADLQAIRDDRRWRFLREWQGAGGVFQHDGRRYLNFSSNDYLDLANHPALKALVREVLENTACGATASRLMSGNLSIHEALEAAITKFCGQESTLVFPSGYQTNVGVLSALAGRGDTIFSDALNHASIIDGARLSRADIQVYRHNDTSHLAELLAAAPSTGGKIIVTDSVFSMDGDLAPVTELSALAREYEAVFVVDEAHAIGIWGEGGGVCKGLEIKPDLITGTLGKSLGSGGAFAAGGAVFRDLLVNKARSFIYSTGLTPMNAAAGLAAVKLIEAEPTMGEALLARSAFFQEQLAARDVPIVRSTTQIVPIMVGDNQRAVDLSEALLAEGLIVTAIRPPTVPEGTARLRFSVTLGHGEEVLCEAAELVARVLVGDGKVAHDASLHS
ncbi:MAG: 8-amino-7-oxononanoate synthase [Candidatus Hydrogenedentes bacterium]|nr:8-amino-7-oxononanoate synthase [Candidatus Hydrogenedentota bacterium]